ncbi:MAG: RluA family pseudouridine synthase [Alphaproteobacteria bacterium]|nr:RluA family pseudouridine synthase [Alphaproteobacteria bacterium]
MIENLTVTAPEDISKIRLDKFLAESFPEYSRNQFIHLIEAGAVQIVGQKITLSPDDKVVAGATYTIIPPEPVEPDPEPENIPLDIVYEDADLLVVNKPAGLVVHPGAGNWTGTLVNALLYHCGDSLSGINGVKRPGIVHRIDKDTSGLLVVAKNDKAHVGLAKQFEVHSIQRTYDAFVWGLTPESGRIEENIGRSSTNRQKMAIVKVGGKPAITHFERVGAYGITASHIKCHLETGRTHQIRVHMTSIKHPLIGDDLYGNAPKGAPENIRSFSRQALHAGLLGFIHPITQKQMIFEVPLPKDLENLKIELEKLK